LLGDAVEAPLCAFRREGHSEVRATARYPGLDADWTEVAKVAVGLRVLSIMGSSLRRYLVEARLLA
jgi:hypothetical protein